MINPQWLELPIYRTNSHGPKDARANEVRLYIALQWSTGDVLRSPHDTYATCSEDKKILKRMTIERTDRITKMKIANYQNFSGTE